MGTLAGEDNTHKKIHLVATNQGIDEMKQNLTTSEQNQSSRNSAKPISPYLSDSQIAMRYDVSRQTTWRWAATDPTFPKPIKLSAGCTRWKLSELEEWESAKVGA